MSRKCIHCGKCCSSMPCGIALSMIGDYRPCIALEKYNDKYYCGLMLHPRKYFNLGIFSRKWKENFIIKLTKEYNQAGMGCCESLSTKIIHNDIRKGLLKKKYKRKYAKRRITSNEFSEKGG